MFLTTEYPNGQRIWASRVRSALNRPAEHPQTTSKTQKDKFVRTSLRPLKKGILTLSALGAGGTGGALRQKASNVATVSTIAGTV